MRCNGVITASERCSTRCDHGRREHRRRESRCGEVRELPQHLLDSPAVDPLSV
ncbi:MAG TPA: hypothetical protein VES42_06640 [Pilimelia sp.]|nr:hypothetical protein [Pilimelia sp.]